MGHPGADVTPLATEFLVEARSGGTCVVRIVTSAYGTGADWENEFWGEMETGWGTLLDNLRVYLTHFAGERATATTSAATFAVTPVEAIDRVRAALGVGTVGDHVDAAGVDGVVERTIAQHFAVRIELPVPGLVSCWSYETAAGTLVSLSAYLYGPDGGAAAERLRLEWQSLLDELARDQAVAPTS